MYLLKCILNCVEYFVASMLCLAMLYYFIVLNCIIQCCSGLIVVSVFVHAHNWSYNLRSGEPLSPTKASPDYRLIKHMPLRW